jgi:hypothetical protein
MDGVRNSLVDQRRGARDERKLSLKQIAQLQRRESVGWPEGGRGAKADESQSLNINKSHLLS